MWRTKQWTEKEVQRLDPDYSIYGYFLSRLSNLRFKHEFRVPKEIQDDFNSLAFVSDEYVNFEETKNLPEKYPELWKYLLDQKNTNICVIMHTLCIIEFVNISKNQQSKIRTKKVLDGINFTHKQFYAPKNNLSDQELVEFLSNLNDVGFFDYGYSFWPFHGMHFSALGIIFDIKRKYEYIYGHPHNSLTEIYDDNEDYEPSEEELQKFYFTVLLRDRFCYVNSPCRNQDKVDRQIARSIKYNTFRSLNIYDILLVNHRKYAYNASFKITNFFRQAMYRPESRYVQELKKHFETLALDYFPEPQNG